MIRYLKYANTLLIRLYIAKLLKIICYIILISYFTAFAHKQKLSKQKRRSAKDNLTDDEKLIAGVLIYIYQFLRYNMHAVLEQVIHIPLKQSY